MTSASATPIRHLLLDLDGTLLGSVEARIRLSFIARAFFLWRASPWRTLRALKAIRLALESAPCGETNDRKVVRAFGEALGLEEPAARELLESSVREMFPKFAPHFFPIPGAAEFISWAGSRFPLWLATNPVWLPEIVELRVRWAGLDPAIFKGITHAKRMTACKPRIEYYEELLRQEGLDASACLLVGNDLRKDLPATRAGIRTFILGPEAQPRALAVEPRAAAAWSGTYEALRAALEGQTLC